jgi:hypothetical protein
MIQLFAGDSLRMWLSLGSMAITFLLFAWVSYDDFKSQYIVVWKLLLAIASLVVFPSILVFAYIDKTLGIMLASSVIPTALLLFLNEKFNKEKIIGKADIDVFTPIFSGVVMYAIWEAFIHNAPENKISGVLMLKLGNFVYYLLGAFIIGSIIVVLVHVIFTVIKMAIKKEHGLWSHLRGQMVSAILMFVPMALVYELLLYTIK